jgi:hypothetical protein
MASVAAMTSRLSVPAVVFGAFAIGLGTAWVYRNYVGFLRAGVEAPGWLKKMERAREFLAGEGPPSASATAGR